MTGAVMNLRRLTLSAGFAVFIAGSAIAEDAAPRDGRIGYVMTNLFWSVYQTDDAKEECPRGFNDGPREQFASLFPDHEGMSVEETQLKQEIRTWHPTDEPDGFEFLEIEGNYGYGLNLDGAINESDFTDPETGELGIDNEVYRAVGCIIGFRGPDGVEYIFQDKAIIDERYNRMMIELTGVDSLTEDDDVTVTLYRGADRLLTDATGLKVMPGGSQRVDYRWGESLIRYTAGRIEDGVLITDPIEQVVIPWMNLGVPSVHIINDMQFRLKLSPGGANGIIGGYADVDAYYKQLIRNDSTHHLSNGQISGISLYKALRRLADAYPDPETGKNTAVSMSLDVKMAQVFVINPAEDAGEESVTH